MKGSRGASPGTGRGIHIRFIWGKNLVMWTWEIMLTEDRGKCGVNVPVPGPLYWEFDGLEDGLLFLEYDREELLRCITGR